MSTQLIKPNYHCFKVWLGSFASVELPSIFLTINLCRPCWITSANFSKSGYFSTRSIWNEVSDPQFLLVFLTQVTHYLTAEKLKKIYRLKDFCVNVLKQPSPKYSLPLSSFKSRIRRIDLSNLMIVYALWQLTHLFLTWKFFRVFSMLFTWYFNVFLYFRLL